VVEIDATVGLHKLCGLSAVRLLFIGVQPIRIPVRPRRPRTAAVHLAGHLGDRHRELARVLDEGLYVAKGERAGRHAVPHDDSYHHVVQVGQELHGRLDRARKELRRKLASVQRLVLGGRNSSMEALLRPNVCTRA